VIPGGFTVRPLLDDDRPVVQEFGRVQWGSDMVVAHGAIYRPHLLAGFVAEAEGAWAGLVTYQIEGNACEVVTLDSVREGLGVGTALLEATEGAARQAYCRRLWLVTTNDNLRALRFYQRRGFHLAVVHRNAVNLSRGIKPQIPLVGDHGIPIRDEIELDRRHGHRGRRRRRRGWRGCCACHVWPGGGSGHRDPVRDTERRGRDQRPQPTAAQSAEHDPPTG